jgi:hypothetical protein
MDLCVCLCVYAWMLANIERFCSRGYRLTSLRVNVAVFSDTKELVVVISNYNLPFLYKSMV